MWILIIIVWSLDVHHVEFAQRDKCEYAAKAVESMDHRVEAYCFPKGD